MCFSEPNGKNVLERVCGILNWLPLDTSWSLQRNSSSRRSILFELSIWASKPSIVLVRMSLNNYPFYYVKLLRGRHFKCNLSIWFITVCLCRRTKGHWDVIWVYFRRGTFDLVSSFLSLYRFESNMFCSEIRWIGFTVHLIIKIIYSRSTIICSLAFVSHFFVSLYKLEGMNI